MIEKNGTEQSPPQRKEPQPGALHGQVISFPIVPPVPALDGSRLAGTGLHGAIAGWKKKSGMPRTRPLTLAQKNKRAQMLEEQKRQLLKADGMDEHEARLKVLAEQKRMLLGEK